MNRLWVRLSLAFTLVTVSGFILAALLANRQVETSFRQFVARSQMESGLVEALALWCGQNGDWTGVEGLLTQARPGSGMMGQGRGMGRMMASPLLTDAEGLIVYDPGGRPQGERLSAGELAAAIPIDVDGGRVGYLYQTTPSRLMLSTAAQGFLQQVNRSLVLAGLLATLVGLAMGLFIARQLAAPLNHLALGARRISQGDLSQRVPEQGTDEVVAVAHAFNDMAGELEQAETLRRNLVADVAHELRTPLTVIQGNLQAILDGIYPLEREEIATIHAETVVLSRLVTDLRDLAQAEAGQLRLNMQELEVMALVAGVVGLCEEPARTKGIDLQMEAAAGLPTVHADPDRLRQVIYNLVSNALRYTPAGGRVRVAGDLAPLGSQPPRTESTQCVRITVADTGPGIPAEQLPHVFDRFWRADPARSREQHGAGLGLTIARQLVEAQGGQIGVDSTVGAGSRFWFTLPAARVTLPVATVALPVAR